MDAARQPVPKKKKTQSINQYHRLRRRQGIFGASWSIIIIVIKNIPDDLSQSNSFPSLLPYERSA